jgi:hypothetical protein
MDVRNAAWRKFPGAVVREADYRTNFSTTYRAIGVNTGLMVKVPLPAQFAVAPPTVHVPAMVPPLTVPSRVRVFTSTPVDITT